MSKRLELRLSDDEMEILEGYCAKTGATKTGAIKMLIHALKDESLLAKIQNSMVQK